MPKLECPRGCSKGWSSAVQDENGQRATCRGCGHQVTTGRGRGVRMGDVGSMTQNKR